ncbi:MAG TPA: HAD family hydrolase [Clostridia bacterium]
MKRPRMILFDYGQTLMDEADFDGLKGTAAVMAYAVTNRDGKTAEEVQAFAESMSRDLRPLCQVEVSNLAFQKYLYESLGITFSLTPSEVEQVFWDHAGPAVLTPHIRELLEHLAAGKIRTGVFSNMSFSGATLADRICRFLPDHRFEFILASSEYIFRKPHRRVFDLLLSQAGLSPEDVWYCGDNVIWDIEGASQCGIFPVWYRGALKRREETPACRHLAIDDWSELLDLLK